MPQWTKTMNTILQKRIEEAARNIAELCPDCDLHCKGQNPCIPKILYQKLIEISTFALQNQWISVEEALPEYDEDVFVRFISRFPNNTDEFEVGYCTRWRTLDKSVKTDSKGFSIIGDMKITHWMERPNLEGGE